MDVGRPGGVALPSGTEAVLRLLAGTEAAMGVREVARVAGVSPNRAGQVAPMRRLPRVLAAGGVAGGVLLGACGGSDSDGSDSAAATTTPTAAASTTTGPPPDAVTVKQFQFMPPELVVKTATLVTWTNQDQILHTATAGTTPGTADGKFDGPMDGVGQSFGFTFDQPGTYPYFCRRHTSMTGTIVVR